MRAKNVAVGSVLILSALCHTTEAHRPIFSPKPATDPNTAVLITQPHISQVIYHVLENTLRGLNHLQYPSQILLLEHEQTEKVDHLH